MNDRILLVLPLPATSVNGRIYIDNQACTGLDHWLTNFGRVTLVCPTQSAATPPASTLPLDTIKSYGRLTFTGMPTAYTPLSFLRTFPVASRALKQLMGEANYLHFAIGGFWGDWGAVAALIANDKKLPFAVWTDRVESQVMMFQSETKRGLSRFYRKLIAGLTAKLETYVIGKSSLGLFHGMDCFNAYEKLSSNPHLVHNINFKNSPHITAAELSDRTSSLPMRNCRFVYAGRAHRDKGIFDWILVFARMHEHGYDFDAVWYGDGPQLDAARAMVRSANLENVIQFRGPIDHDTTLRELKSFDAFVFCHQTPESPRCLIEAMVCGLPLIGYDSPYPNHLISEHCGGILTEPRCFMSLSDRLMELTIDPERLKLLGENAAKDGEHFTPERVFKHRSDLMRTIPLRA